MTRVSAAYNVGAVIGPIIGGSIAAAGSYRYIFAFSSLLFLLSSAVIALVRPQPVEPPPARQAQNKGSSYRPYLGFLLVNSLVAFALYLPQPLAPNYLQNQAGLTTVEIGRLYAAGGLGVVTLNLLLGQLDGRAGYLLSQACVGFYALLLWRGGQYAWFGLALFLLGGFRVARILAAVHIRSLVPPGRVGLAFGLAEAASSLMVAAAPVLAGLLYTRQPGLVFAVSLVLIGAAAAASALFFYFSNRKPQEVLYAHQLD